MLFAGQLADIKMMLPWYRIKRKKQSIRGVMDQRRRICTAEQVAADSALIIAKLEQLPVFQQASVVMLYYPVHNEVDLRPLLSKYAGSKTFLFPIAHRHSMEVRPYEGEELMKRGRLGIPEPQTLPYKGEIDLTIVPGVAFDAHCRRLGHGGGYYDRFIRNTSATTIGVGYDFQIEKHSLPHSWFDRPVDMVLTPTRSIGE